MIRRLLVPIHDAEGVDASTDHALWLAREFDAQVGFAAVFDERQFSACVTGPSEGAVPYLDTRALEAHCQRIEQKIRRLVGHAKDAGLSAMPLSSPVSIPEGIIEATRRFDLLVESQLHREPLLARKLLCMADVYTESCCPVLVSAGRPYGLDPVLVIHTASRPANLLLRWVLAFAGERPMQLHTLIVDDDPHVLERLQEEATTLADARGRTIAVATSPDADAVATAQDLSRQLETALVALPPHAFKHPFRLRVQGFDARLLRKLHGSTLLFPSRTSAE